MTTRKKKEPETTLKDDSTIEDVINELLQLKEAIRGLPKAEQEQLQYNDAFITELSDSMRGTDARELIAARLLSDELRSSLVTYSLGKDNRRQLGLTIPVRVYLQDPALAEVDDRLKPQPVEINWEPCLTDGPTSSRVAVVDYDGSTGHAEPPAKWDEDHWAWVLQPVNGESPGRVPEAKNCPQFRQVNVWAVVESILEYFEDKAALGRPVPWGFDGNRLIIVPHAGLGENAYYDRRSKSLQFYYCGPAEKRVYTCLSHDIVAHEMGHAILDGIRPHYNEHPTVETAAFHEFVADLTAMLMAFRNNTFRGVLKTQIGSDLPKDKYLNAIGEEFGQYVEGRPYIRSARNRYKVSDITDGWSAHDRSQVLTGAMFDIMAELAAGYRERARQKEEAKKTETQKAETQKGKPDAHPLQTLWRTASRISSIALQPLDFCPPVDIRFRDYAEAVIAYDLLTHRFDPYEERKMMRAVFAKRGIELPEDNAFFKAPSSRLEHVGSIAAITDSHTTAYRFLAQNRDALGIPFDVDFEVPEPYSAVKRASNGATLPKEYFIQYVWSEEIDLPNEERFGTMSGFPMWLPCGGTLVYDENGNFLYWAFKPGTKVKFKDKEKELKYREKREKRREEFVEEIARLVAQGELSFAGDSAVPFGMRAPVTARKVDGRYVLETASRLHGSREQPIPTVRSRRPAGQGRKGSV